MWLVRVRKVFCGSHKHYSLLALLQRAVGSAASSVPAVALCCRVSAASMLGFGGAASTGRSPPLGPGVCSAQCDGWLSYGHRL